ncbi:hypothetical protein B1H20_03470 [Streptomyces violaceoruber]|uniref:Ava_C0101 and related proteins n=1 Tax=Streptomyces violaceoruber TaxID=1935 RepID=A0A1V0U5S6_STRVN|nr:DUF5996 family protein [Streptomyces violaceoruber]ARF60553.1 hypothetical protein B1H20_03470 [Streptomyces violaceoruber]
MDLFPPLPRESWAPTKETLHRFLQIVGKVRLAAGVRRNHWWNVPFHLTGDGITTRPSGPVGDGTVFTVDFDFTTHRLRTLTLDGRQVSFPLTGLSVGDFYREFTGALQYLGIDVVPEHPYPFDLPDAARPFAEDDEHATYDQAAVSRYWTILTQVMLVLEKYAAGYSGKTSPVHHFWHTFDLAVTRFSDRHVAQGRSVDPVTREAYSREVISSGFWFGDERSYSEPAFYSYTAPEPDGLQRQPLEPPAARWTESNGSHLALLPYDDVRTAPDASAEILRFYDTAYAAGARLAGWHTDRLCPGGVTDPQVSAPPRPGGRPDIRGSGR